MKCPHCNAKLTLSEMWKSMKAPQSCSQCHEGYTLTISVKRMFILILPVAASLVLIRPISLYWGIPPSLFSGLIIILYGMSCLTLAKRSMN